MIGIDRKTLLRWLLVTAVTTAVGLLGFILPKLGARLTLPLLPSGIALAATTRWGRALWPAGFAAGMLINVWLGRPWLTDALVGLGLAGGAVLTSTILKHYAFDPNFTRPRDVVVFLLATGVGMTLAPTLGMAGYQLAGLEDLMPLSAVNWFRWWSNVTAGALMLTPLLVAINRQSLARLKSQRLAAAIWLLALLACVVVILLGPAPLSRGPIVVFALTLIVVAAIRFGLVPSAAAALVVSGATAFSFAFGRGAFGGGDELAGLVTLWSFAGALVSLSLLVTALLTERDAAAGDKLRAERRYAQVFDGSPQPLWVHDPRTLKFLLVNEAAIRQYGWSRAEFLERVVAALAATGDEPVLPPREPTEGLGEGPGPFETRHRTRDGRILDVEIWTRAIDFDGHPADLVFAIDVTERRALGRALLEAITGEQRRIGQDMHDGLGQELTGLALSLRALATQAERERIAMAAELGQLSDMVSGCIESTRRIVRGLSPLSDADGNLVGALESLAHTSSLSGTPVRSRTRMEAPLLAPLEVRSHLLRIAQEAVQNALKHASAKRVEIDLWVRTGTVTLSIEDDGKGLGATDRAGAGLGMRTMRFRAAAIGGRLHVARRRGGGTMIVCEAPQTVPVAARL